MAAKDSDTDHVLAGVERLLELHYHKLSHLIDERLRHVPCSNIPPPVEHHEDRFDTQTASRDREITSRDNGEEPDTNLNDSVPAQQPDGENGLTHDADPTSSKEAMWKQCGVKCPRLLFVKQIWFELVIAAVILLNTIFYGAEVQYLAQNLTTDTHPVFAVANYMFVFIFLIEIILRILFDCSEFFCTGYDNLSWNYFDLLVVCISLVDLFMTMASTDTSTDITYVRVLRIVRMVRLLRIVRLLKFFRPMRVLVQSVLNTMKSLTWTVLLLIIILFLFGVVYTQAATGFFTDRFCNAAGRTCPPSLADVEDTPLYYYFGTVPSAILSLFKTLTGGVSWQDVIKPLEEIGLFWALFFVAFISFCYLAVLNIVTGIVCSTAIESASEDLDMQVQASLADKDRFTKRLKDLFVVIDADHSGTISVQELENVVKADSEGAAAVFAAMDISVETALQLCTLLDTDHNKSISVDEFVEGCLRLRGTATATDIHMLMHESHINCLKISTLLRYFEEDFPSELREQILKAMRAKSVADNVQFSPFAHALELGFAVEI